MSEPNIQDNSIYSGPAYISIEPTTGHPKETSKGASSQSTLQKSEERLAEEMIAAMNTPMLVPPADFSLKFSAGTLIAMIGDNVIGEVKVDIWKKYQENLDEIKAQIQKTISSPTYQALERARIHGGDGANVSGVQIASAANAAQANPVASGLINHIESLHHNMSSVTPAETDVAQMTIPMTTMLLIAGVPAIATMEISAMSSNPIQGSLDIIGKLQQSLPGLGLQDVVPLINLMVMAPIYFNALIEATSHLPNKERENNVAAAKNFAQTIIKMVSNPDYIMVNFVNKMEGADRMSPERKQTISTTIRLILATVSLSLLYSVQTGKVQGKDFWGINPQELRDMLNGTLTAPDPGQQTSDQGTLSATLINIIQVQLASLPVPQRLSTVNAILAFVSTSQSVKTMLDPHKVVNNVFAAMDFDEGQKIAEEKKG